MRLGEVTLSPDPSGSNLETVMFVSSSKMSTLKTLAAASALSLAHSPALPTTSKPAPVALSTETI